MASELLEWVEETFTDPQVDKKFGIIGGLEGSESTYVIKAKHGKGVLPGKLVFSKEVAYFSFNDKEYFTKTYEYLRGPLEAVSWVRTKQGAELPLHAIPGGTDPNGDISYIGRGTFNGKLILGRINERTGICYGTYYGKEYKYTSYEILVRNEYAVALELKYGSSSRKK